MEKIVIVGSGASAVHFALTLVRKNYQVIMLDVGYQKPAIVNGEDNFNALKVTLQDPVEYFLGKNFEAVVWPDDDSEYYGFPPNKKYIFSLPPQLDYRSSGFEPLFSFAQGGLAEAWTGGVYPLNEDELSEFTFSHEEIAPYYAEIANRIGIAGTKDDLANLFPFHENIMDPLKLDEHSNILLSEYEKNRNYLNKKLNVYMGRSRISTLSHDKETRKKCTYSGRCIWGCPVGALYTPSLTLEKCKTYSNFQYISNLYVTHFRYNSGHHIKSVVAESTTNGKRHEFALDKLVLTAGTLSSSRIFLESIFKDTGEVIKLHGLMDNRQILVPFINLKMLCKAFEPESYQYHQLAMGIKTPNPKEYIHGQITTLKTALIQPIIQSIPFDLKTSTYLFRNVHSALGVININFPDYRRNDNYVTLTVDNDLTNPILVINYKPIKSESRIIAKAMKTFRRAFWKLGCIIPPGMAHIRPMGASVHYSGTIPMSQNSSSFTTSEFCQSHDFDNLFIVDGSVFPFLPAKNLTFTLMANAIRVADTVF